MRLGATSNCSKSIAKLLRGLAEKLREHQQIATNKFLLLSLRRALMSNRCAAPLGETIAETAICPHQESNLGCRGHNATS